MINLDKNIKVLFFGDLVGKPGRFAVRDFLAKHCSDYSGCGKSVVSPHHTGWVHSVHTAPYRKSDFVIANVENASHGFGLTEKNYNDLISYGIDCMTSGNHIWDKRDIFTYIDNADRLIRPINYPTGTKGVGSRVFDCGDYKIAVLNILGKVFINAVDFQWDMIIDEIKRLKEITPIVIIDFHAEATAEKICFAKYCSELGVSAFFGTHTHVQTADESIINGMGYITDAGFCGCADGVIGMEYQTSLAKFLTGIPERYEVAVGNNIQICAVEVEIEPKTGYTVAIRRIFSSRNNDKEGDNED